ncbi:MAG TPA: Fe-S protein assembly co-chaperone HscB [Anaeromyxobacter sp.]
MTCWSCKADVAEGSVFCPACRKIQPVGRNEDHFSLFGLERAYALDMGELERRFRELSRLLHPDRFARAEPRERRLSLERATRLNDAYRSLRDWRLRAAYLLRLAGTDVFAEGRTYADPDFLEEQLEWREHLALAQADGDLEALRRIAADARERLRRLEHEVARRFEDERWFSDLPVDIARRLSRARYYDNIVADAERASAASAQRQEP